MKYLAVTALFSLFAAWQIWVERPWRYVSSRSPWWGYVSAGAFLLIGPATFLAYRVAVHGRPLAGLGGQMTRTPYLLALEYLIGEHLDQSHGLFWHQPLFLSGLIALGWMIRVRHPFVIFWLLLYGSLMAPPALLAQYGGMPLGRLNWGGIWLWLLPMGWWMRAERASLERYVRPVVLTAFAYQAILACRWIPNPTDLIRLPLAKPDLGGGGRSTDRDRMEVERRRTASSSSRLGRRRCHSGSPATGRADRGPGNTTGCRPSSTVDGFDRQHLFAPLRSGTNDADADSVPVYA